MPDRRRLGKAPWRAGYLFRMSQETRRDEENPERAYWRAVSNWVVATRERYRGYSRGELTQCFMRGPFAGWSEREVASLADRLSECAGRFPLHGQEDLDWGCDIEPAVPTRARRMEGRADGARQEP